MRKVGNDKKGGDHCICVVRKVVEGLSRCWGCIHREVVRRKEEVVSSHRRVYANGGNGF